MDFWEVPIPILGKRDGSWRTVRAKYLELNPSCICCGKIKELEVHHLIPVHIDPTLELEAANLATFCERCHLVVAHLNDWNRYNPFALDDSAMLLSRHTENHGNAK